MNPHSVDHSQRVPSDVFDLLPEELVYLSVKRLSAANVHLVDFRSSLYRRMNVPLIIMNFTYLVEDDLLINASSSLIDMGLPLARPANYVLRTQGDFMQKGKIHQLTRSNRPGDVQYLILLPYSFGSFSLDELRPTPLLPPEGSKLPPKPINVFCPRPSSVYAFLFRTLSCYPKANPTRTQLLSDLSELIMYDMLGLEGFTEEDEEDLDPSDDPAVQLALDKVRYWSKVGEWRNGEEWIGDCLGAILEGTGNYDFIPWTAPALR